MEPNQTAQLHLLNVDSFDNDLLVQSDDQTLSVDIVNIVPTIVGIGDDSVNIEQGQVSFEYTSPFGDGLPVVIIQAFEEQNRFFIGIASG